MAISVVRGATKNARIAWQPFQATPPAAISELYSFVWAVAVIFSVGSVFLPGLLVIRSQLPPAGAAIVLVFVVLLFAGGFLLFSVPQFMLYKLAQDQRDRVLDRLVPIIERHISQFEGINHQEPLKVFGSSVSLWTVLHLRSQIASQILRPFLAHWHARRPLLPCLFC